MAELRGSDSAQEEFQDALRPAGFQPVKRFCNKQGLSSPPCPGFVLVLNVACRICYRMCTQKQPNEYSQPLYDNYKKAFEDYIRTKVRYTCYPQPDPLSYMCPCETRCLPCNSQHSSL